MYDVIASAVNHPDAIRPYRSLFNHRSLDALASTDTSVQVVSPRPFAPPLGPYSDYFSLPDIEDWGKYETHHPRFLYLLPKRLFYGLSGESFSKRVPRYVDRRFEAPDVVHACHIYLDGYGMLPYCRKYDLPLFVVSHGKLLNTFDDQPRSVQSKIQETLDEATGVLCVSDALAEKAAGLTNPSKVSTVPIGADPSKFPTDRKQKICRELGLAEDKSVVLFVGSFVERKGISELIELLPRLDLPNAEFVFVGHGGDMKQELREAISRSGFSTEYLFTGISSEMLRQWFVAADLLLLPSHAEGRPTVIYEAMASETAVLASDVGGVSEQVADSETGVLLPAGDVDAIESTITSLVANSERLDQMGRRGHERLVEKGWTWSDHARRIRKIHMDAI